MRVNIYSVAVLLFSGLVGCLHGHVKADVVKLERIELIQESELIFGGQVLSRTCRWNEKGNLIVTDYEFFVDRVFKGFYEGETISLTFAGGELDGEGHSVSNVPSFEVDQVVVLMLESADRPLLSPLTGSHQGKFYLADFDGAGNPVVLDGSDNPVTDQNGAALNLRDFYSVIIDEVAQAEKLPPRDLSVPEHLRQFILTDLPELPYNDASKGVSAKLFEPLSDLESESPSKFEKKRYFEDPVKEEELPRSGGGGVGTMYSYTRRAKTIPIVFNPWPSSAPEWLRFHDQYALSRWNVYSDLYRVMESTGDWAWQNDRFDMCGFVNNQTMIDQFGSGWGANTLAVCWRRWEVSTQLIIEADIAFNPEKLWTTTPFAAYFNTNIHYLPQTMTHEVGHSWGLNHDFTALSTMNYLPHRFRSYDLLYLDDVLAARDAYPTRTVSRTDAGVYLFNVVGSQNAIESTVSQTSVVTGSNVTVGNIVLENLGTTSIAPTLDWYLVPSIGSWSGAYYLGSTNHGTLNSGQFFQHSRALTIPSGIPNGTYYFAAFLTNSNDSVGSNNSSWLSRQITVQNVTSPPNDNWANAISVPPPYPKTVFGTNVGATTQANEQHVNPAQATVWWYVQAPTNGSFTIDTFGSNFDTMLHVYTGYENGFANLTLVANNDDANGTLQSRVTFVAQANQFYEVRVAGWNGDSGNIQLNVSFANTSSEISSAFVYYAGSSFDTGNLDAALDTSKVVAKQTTTPQTLGYGNLINSTGGITGIVFDMQNLPANSLDAADFRFQVSPTGAFDEAGNPPETWQNAPLPNAIVVLPGPPKRVVLQWPANSVENRWLRITLRANANTALPSDEVYFIGHLLGETTGLSGNTYTVGFSDVTPIRVGIGTNANASSNIDIDKNGTVNFADISSMNSNIGTQLTNITVP